jgi:hypothetical protein
MSLANPAGESNSEALGFGYDRRLMLGSVVTSDAGLLTGRKVTTLGLCAMSRGCANSFSVRLVGYEAVSDAERLHYDQARRWREGGSGRCGLAEPDGPLRDPTALGCQDLVWSHGNFGPKDRRIADTSWQ